MVTVWRDEGGAGRPFGRSICLVKGSVCVVGRGKIREGDAWVCV